EQQVGPPRQPDGLDRSDFHGRSDGGGGGVRRCRAILSMANVMSANTAAAMTPAMSLLARNGRKRDRSVTSPATPTTANNVPTASRTSSCMGMRIRLVRLDVTAAGELAPFGSLGLDQGVQLLGGASG